MTSQACLERAMFAASENYFMAVYEFDCDAMESAEDEKEAWTPAAATEPSRVQASI
jgi:hypothetical protein